MAISRVSTAPGTTHAPGPGRVAEVLERTVGPCVLHDRHGRSDTSACAAVGPAGVYVILAEEDDGKVVKRIVGGWRQPDERLYVDSRDRSALLDDLGHQVRGTVELLAQRGLGSVPVSGVLCFVGARWPLFGLRPLRFRDAIVLWPDALARHVVSPGSLDAAGIARATAALAGGLRAA
jgi:hypothetical protein